MLRSQSLTLKPIFPLAFPIISPNWIKIMMPKLVTFVKFYSGDACMHLKAVSLNLLP